MAQTTYVSKQAVTTLAARKVAYERVADLFLHLHGFNLNFVSLSVRADSRLELVLNNPLPASQLDHLGVEAA